MAAPLPEDPALPDALERVSRMALAVGIVALLASAAAALASGGAEGFYRSYLAGFVFWNGIAVGCLAVLGIQYLTGGAWGIAIRRLLEAGTRTLPLMAILFLPLAIGLRHVYEWSRAGAMAKDELLRKKALYLNESFFLGRAVLYFLLWLGLAWLLNRWSLAQDASGGRAVTGRLQRAGAAALLIYALTVTFSSIDWVMSLEPHWFSTMYGVIFMVSQALGAMALVIAALLLLSRYRPLSDFLTPAHLHDLGKMLFAFVMIWSYVSFSQYLIIWSGNLPEEIPWYLARFRGGWGWIGLLVLLFQFLLPFLLLISRAANRNPRLLITAAAMVVAVRFVDVLWLILPAFSPARFAIRWTDLAVPIGIGGLWLAVFAAQLTKRPLLPYGDPDFTEALAHGRH
ncbi:MAG TPA: hypothetical protein VGS00_11490 [Thermoanaerobaculia bacterium]|nr:hypothetical protein [Thermoanaerobaculia bacterium]